MLNYIISKPKIILDVPLEDLKAVLSKEGWDVSTVTEKLGSTKEARSDENILKYSKETNSVVITVDVSFGFSNNFGGTLFVRGETTWMNLKINLHGVRQ